MEGNDRSGGVALLSPLNNNQQDIHRRQLLPSPGGMTFPEALEKYREEAKKTSDSNFQLDYCSYLIDACTKIQEDPDSLGLDFTNSGADSGDVVNNRKAEMIQQLEGEVLKWLKRLSSGGKAHPEALFLLGEAYGKGKFRVDVDHAKAFSLYIQAAKANHPIACYRVAVCHEVGAGTKRDCRRAVQFYRKSAALGHLLAMHKIGLILLYGTLNQHKNLKEGISWLKRAAASASAEHPEALHDLAQCYEKHGGCPVVIPDERYASELYSQAANYGYGPSQYRLGTFYEFGIYGCLVDPVESIKWYSKAAERGYADAELALSGWYLSGAKDYLRQNDNNAYLWARKAADRGHARAEFAVGHYFEVGIGVTADLDEAKTWYEKSAAKGYKRAVQKLAELKKGQKNGRKAHCIVA